MRAERSAATADATEPSAVALVRWLTGITRPVHGPLLLSTLLRCINLTGDILLFGLAGWTIAQFAQGHGTAGSLWLLAAVALGKAVAYYLEQFLGHYVAFKALELLRGHAFAMLWPQSAGVLSRSRSGDTLTSLTRDVDRIEVVYAHTFAPVISAIVVPTVFLLAIGAGVSWPVVALPAVAYLLSMIAVPLIGVRRAFAATRVQLARRGALGAHVTDSVFGVEEVVGYGQEAARLREMDAQGREIARVAVIPATVRGIRRAVNTVVMLLTCLAVVTVGLHSGLELAVVAALAAGSLRMYEGPRGVEDAIGALDASFAAARRLWRLCHGPVPLESGKRDVAELTGPLTVQWRDVTFTHQDAAAAGHSATSAGAGSAHPTLAGVTMTAPAGGHCVFVGHSGSGKTTAVQLLERFAEVDSGEILLNNTPVREFTLASLRRAVVYVQQRNQVLDTTIADNLRLGAPEASEEQLWQALRTVCLDDEVRAMPRGLATRTGQDGTKLSGGQAQRLCLARALLVRPRVLVLDEFTANLNVELDREIRARLKRSFPELTVVEITHRLSETASAERIYRFASGRVTEVTGSTR